MNEADLEFFNLGYEAGCVNDGLSPLGVDSTPMDRAWWLMGWTSGREFARFIKEREEGGAEAPPA
jgi:hypothetical protein